MSPMNDAWRRIVVGVGRGGTSAYAIADALRMATEIGDVTVHVVGVIEKADGHHVDRLRQDMLDEETFLVSQVKARAESAILAPAKISLVFHVRVGNPAEVLTQVAFDVDASLLIVGAHPTSRVGQILHSSVAETLLAKGQYPVLVSRPVNAEGLVRTPRPDPRRPGEPLHDTREAMLESSDRVDFGLSASRVSSGML